MTPAPHTESRPMSEPPKRRWLICERDAEDGVRRLAFDPQTARPDARWRVVGEVEAETRSQAKRAYELRPAPHPANDPEKAGEIAAVLDDIFVAVRDGRRRLDGLWPKRVEPDDPHYRRQRARLVARMTRLLHQLDRAATEWDALYRNASTPEAP